MFVEFSEHFPREKYERFFFEMRVMTAQFAMHTLFFKTEIYRSARKNLVSLNSFCKATKIKKKLWRVWRLSSIAFLSHTLVILFDFNEFLVTILRTGKKLKYNDKTYILKCTFKMDLVEAWIKSFSYLPLIVWNLGPFKYLHW